MRSLRLCVATTPKKIENFGHQIPETSADPHIVEMKQQPNIMNLPTDTSKALTLLNDSPVRPVSFGEALKISLDSYYDLLKTQVGGLGADEYLQLKLVADPVDISGEKYRYWSQFNLLNRCDLAIEPVPVGGTLLTSADELSRVYGRFLQRLRGYAVRKDLTAEDQIRLAELNKQIDRDSTVKEEYELKQHSAWQNYCAATGQNPADYAFFLQWRAGRPETRRIDELRKKIGTLWFDIKTITDREYSDPEDAEIIAAENDFHDPTMRLRYPNRPDYEYATPLTLEYLSALPYGSTALFSDRRAMTWNVSLENMLATGAGGFSSVFDRQTSESNSIKTDWSASVSGGYAFIRVKASASEHREISDDFRKGTKITLGAKAAYKVQIIYPGWFHSHLFRSKRVKENIRDFEDFFGPTGVLRFYPIGIIMVRGFTSSFESTQSWKYDYKRTFSASGGGGFSSFGINFGGSASYGSHVEQHKVDVSNTTLTFADGDATLRFVGYVVKRNTLWESAGNGIDGSLSPVTEPGDKAAAIGALAPRKVRSPISDDRGDSSAGGETSQT